MKLSLAKSDDFFGFIMSPKINAVRASPITIDISNPALLRSFCIESIFIINYIVTIFLEARKYIKNYVFIISLSFFYNRSISKQLMCSFSLASSKQKHYNCDY